MSDAPTFHCAACTAERPMCERSEIDGSRFPGRASGEKIEICDICRNSMATYPILYGQSVWASVLAQLIIQCTHRLLDAVKESAEIRGLADEADQAHVLLDEADVLIGREGLPGRIKALLEELDDPDPESEGPPL